MAAARPKLILDLGMHHGEDTVAYLRRGFRVVAIEANPSHIDFKVRKHGCPRTRLLDSYMQWLHNFSIPHWDPDRRLNPDHQSDHQSDLTVINAAVTPHGGSNITVVLCKNGVNGVSSHVLGAEKETCDRPIEVLSLTCGELILRYGRPWFVKIDVEGMENACIESILALPTSLLPETIAFESPLRAPTPQRGWTCSGACIAAFVHIVDAMNARGYSSWKRQWWRMQSRPGMLPDEVKDKGSAGLETWVKADEVRATACGFFNVSQYASLKKRWISHISESTGCDLHARLGPRTTSAESSSGARAPVTTIASQLLHPRCSGVPLERCHTTLNSTYASQYEWNRLCHGGVVTVVTK